MEDQAEKLQIIRDLIGVYARDVSEAASAADEWNKKLGFIRRTSEVLAADLAAKQATKAALESIEEDVAAGKL